MVYTRKAIATRGRILDSAAELMFAKGFAQTKLLEVLNAANVQKGNFYYYFGSKEELGLAVIQERGATVIKEWLESVVDPAEKPWQNIQALAHGIAGLNSSPPESGDLIQILAHERLEAGSELRQAIGEVLGGVIKTFSREFSRMQHSGQLNGATPPELYGAYLFSLLEGALLVFQYKRDRETLKNTVEIGLRSIQDNATSTAG